jgi:hypothetical protein
MKINDKGERFEVILTFPDVRAIDLEVALHLASKEKQWEVLGNGRSYDESIYRIEAQGTFQATVRFTHGLEPPTWAYVENKPPGDETYRAAARRSTGAVAEALLKECADRGLISDGARDRALAKLDDIRA